MSKEITKQLIIDNVLKTNKISTYLASKNIFPAKGPQTNGRIRYACPLHQEKEPSFVLYTNDQHENFYCFGCHQGGTIITLYTALEHISFGETLKHFSKDLVITDENELNILIQQLKNVEQVNTKKNVKDDLGKLSLQFSILGYRVLQKSDFDDEAVQFLEKVYQKIDNYIKREDLVALEECYDKSMKDKLFGKTMVYFCGKKEKKLKKQLLERLGKQT